MNYSNRYLLNLAILTCVICTYSVKASFPFLIASQNATSSVVSKDDILSLPQHYYHRDPFYSEIAEMKGKYKVFKSDSEGMFHPLFIPMYKGVRRIGVMPLTDYYHEKIRLTKRMDPLRKAFLERLWNDSQLYNNLKLVNLMSPHINNAILKSNNSGLTIYDIRNPGEPYKKDASYIPKTHMQSLASGLFTPKTYQKYFCTETSECSNRFLASRGIFQWGGAQDEFRANKLYFDFVENQVAKFKLWACQLNHSVYFVGITDIGEYDFDKKGYMLTLQTPVSYNGRRQIVYSPKKANNAFLDPNSQYSRVFFPLDEEQAEKLSTSHEKLYFAVKARIYGHGSRIGTRYPSSFYTGVSITYDLTGDKIEFYTDDLLIDKVYEKKITLAK